MRKALGLLVGLMLVAGGVLLGLYGLFALLYGGENGGTGDTYVKLGGREIDAGVVGAIALLIAFLLLLAAVPFLKRERSSAESS
jgi:divalent metal cation (Fe/Co/Zn/Cd) transporter